MKAKLKGLHSPDVDLEVFWPDNTANFGFFLQAMIGPDGEEGEDSFGIQVCTPDWLKARFSEEKIVSGKGMLIVFDYDLTGLEAYISQYCARCTGATWNDIVPQLRLLGKWEFEDYVPFSASS